MRIILVALIVFSAQGHDEEEPFADVLHRVIRASRENFLAGAGRAHRDAPGQPVVLPGESEFAGNYGVPD